MSQEMILIGVWNGDYVQIVGALVQVNPELTVRVQRRKLVIKHKETGFYSCIPQGEPVKIPNIPIYDNESE